MTVKEEYTALIESYPDASPEEKERIIRRTNELTAEHEDEVAEAMVECLKKLTSIAKTIRVRQALEPVSDLLVMKTIAREYFHRSNGWLIQRLNSNLHNGKPATFTDADMLVMKNALKDISRRLAEAAERL